MHAGGMAVSRSSPSFQKDSAQLLTRPRSTAMLKYYTTRMAKSRDVNSTSLNRIACIIDDDGDDGDDDCDDNDDGCYDEDHDDDDGTYD